MKDKKFIASLLIIFLIFSVTGKYTKDRSKLSSNYVYATTVKDPKTGKEFQYEVQMVADDKVKVAKTNVETGQKVYEEVYQGSATRDQISVNLPKDQTQLVVKRNDNPMPLVKPTSKVEVKSKKYVQIPKTTATIPVAKKTELVSSSSTSSSTSKESSSSQSETKASTSDSSKKSEDKSTSQTSKSTSSSTESSSSSTVASSSASKMEAGPGASQTEALPVQAFTKEESETIISEFGKWLSESDYGKDAIVVRNKVDGVCHFGASNTVFTSAKTIDGKLLTRLLGKVEGDISEDVNGMIDGEKASSEELIAHKDSFDLALLGLDLESTDAADYQSEGAFRIYSLKKAKQAYYTSQNDEFTKEVTPAVPDKENVGAKNDGYDYYYDQVVDQTKDSYQILLANNGRVYFVKNYWIGEDRKVERDYQLANDDIQKAYQTIIKKYKKTSDSSSSTSSSSTEDETSTSKTEATTGSKTMNIEEMKNGNFSSVAGVWKSSRTTMTIDASGNVTYTPSTSGFTQYIDIKYAKIEDGVLNAAITSPEAMASGTVPFIFIPAGVEIPTMAFVDGEVDKTDKSKDRFFGTQSKMTSDGLNQEIFYRAE